MAKYDPFLSLDCARVEGVGAQSKERKGSYFAIWQPCSQFAVVVLSIIITAMMVVILVGNILVVIAIFTERNLAGVQNWFIASLAAADLCIGSIIMPFSLAYTLLGMSSLSKSVDSASLL